jgi:hypothetical protein
MEKYFVYDESTWVTYESWLKTMIDSLTLNLKSNVNVENEIKKFSTLTGIEFSREERILFGSTN